MGKKKKIKDSPQYLGLKKQADSTLAIVNNPLLAKLFGVDENMVAQANELAQKTEKMLSMPDRFNDHFVERGWIVYDRLNHELRGGCGFLDRLLRWSSPTRRTSNYVQEKTFFSRVQGPSCA